MASQRHACTRLSQIQSPVAAKLSRSENPNPSRISVPPEKTRRGIGVNCHWAVDSGQLSVVERAPLSILYPPSSLPPFQLRNPLNAPTELTLRARLQIPSPIFWWGNC